MRPHPLCAGWLRGRTRHRRIEFVILGSSPDKWDARVTINGATIRAMTAYSYFGNSAPPRGFVVALLGEDRSEFLVFRDGSEDWLEFGDYTYRKCNRGLAMKSDEANPPFLTSEIGTPLDDTKDLYRFYVETRDVEATAERLLRDFLGDRHAANLQRLTHGFELVMPLLCAPDLVRLLSRENVAIYQVMRYAKVGGDWR